MNSHEHPFAQYVRTLGKGKKGSRSLSQEEAYTAFTMILNNEVEDIQLGAFLMLLRVKEESAEEIAGFVQACKDFIKAPKDITVDIDWSSYAGKRKQLPWFIASLLILADNGKRIFIHAAKGHTHGRLYTENVFQELGLPISKDWNEANAQLDQSCITLMSVESICKPLHNMLNMRNTLGLRSPVHTLTRLINPLEATFSFQSIFHPAYASTHQEAAHLLGQNNMAVFKGESGEIERKCDATCLVKSIINDELHEEKWPRLQADKQTANESLNIQHLQAVWRGDSSDTYGENAVKGTLAIILKQMDSTLSIDEAQTQATTLWLSRNKQRL